MLTSENATCWVVLLKYWFHYLESLTQNKYSHQESQKSFSLYSSLDTNLKWGSRGVVVTVRQKAFTAVITKSSMYASLITSLFLL